MKKNISLLLTVVMLISLLPIVPLSASAEDEMLIPETLNAVKVSCGFDCVAAIDDGFGLWCQSAGGTAGDGGGYHIKNAPSRIFPGRITEVKSSIRGYNLSNNSNSVYGQAAALNTQCELWIWGNSRFGTLGNGNYGNNVYSNVPVKVPLEDVIDFDVSCLNSAAVTVDGSLYIWGENNNKQVLGATATIVNTPTKVMENVKSVALGYASNGGAGCVAVIKNDDSLWMWGFNYAGNIGVAPVTNGTTISEPVKVLDNVREVSLGYGYTLALKNDDTLWSWGANDSGCLGTGGTTSTHVPQQIMTNVKSVSAGCDHVLALKNNGSLYSWGRNSYGQLGNQSTASTYMPMKIMGDVLDFDAGYYNSVALKDDGTIWNWGVTKFAASSLNGIISETSSTPVQIDLTNRTVNYKAEGQQRYIDIAWNDDWLENRSTEYNRNLSIAGVVLSAAAENNNAEDTLNKLGYRTYANNTHLEYNYDTCDIDKPACSVGYKVIYNSNGKKSIDIVLVCCGTRYKENIFENGDILTDIKAKTDGFYAAGMECYSNLNKAITNIASGTGMNITADNARLFVTGHSLGGACANVVTWLATKTEQFDTDKISMYTYASPKVCVDQMDFATRYAVPRAYNVLNNSGDSVHWFWNFSYVQVGSVKISGLNGRMGKDVAFNNLETNYKFRAHAATLYGQQYDDLFSMFRAHYATTYFAALLSVKPIEYAAKTFRLLSAHCPVDVAVYDSAGNPCGYTKDGVAYNDNHSPVRIVVIEDEKFIEIPDDGNEYAVKYTGTDTGIMKVQDQIYDLETGEVESEKVFEGVVLEEGKQFESVIDAEDTDKTDLYVIDSEGDKISSVDVNGAETDLYSYDITEHNIQISTDSCKYDGTAKTQTVSVDGLTEGADYRVIYDNNIAVGTATVTVKGINEYYGRISKTFKIYDEGTCNDTVSWKLSSSGVLTVIGTGAISDYNTENAAPWSAHAAAITKIVIVDGITAIGSETFKGCAEAMEIFIPATVKKIGDNAVSGCAKLANIHYTGSETEWNAIIVGEENAEIASAEKEYSSTESGHIWNSGTVTRPATCSAAGVRTYTCSDCGAVKTEPIAKKAHKVVVDKAVPATFKKAGKTQGKHCSVCGKVIVAQKAIPKLKAASLSKVTPGKQLFKATWKKVASVDGYQVQYSLKSNFSGAKTVTVKGAAKTGVTVKKLKAKKKYYVRIRAYKKINGKNQYAAWSKSKTVKTK